MQKQALDVSVVRPRALVTALQKRLWRIVAHFTYTWIENRSIEYENKPLKRCRVPVSERSVSYDDMKSMIVKAWVRFAFQSVLLHNMQGEHCPGVKRKDSII